jgi:hypothetical protein
MERKERKKMKEKINQKKVESDFEQCERELEIITVKDTKKEQEFH